MWIDAPLVQVFEWVGCYTGLMGAALLAFNFRYSGFGWIFFLISNFAWVGFALMTETTGLEFQHYGFMATSLLGMYRWLFKPSADRVYVD